MQGTRPRLQVTIGSPRWFGQYLSLASAIAKSYARPAPMTSRSILSRVGFRCFNDHLLHWQLE